MKNVNAQAARTPISVVPMACTRPEWRMSAPIRPLTWVAASAATGASWRECTP